MKKNAKQLRRMGTKQKTARLFPLDPCLLLQDSSQYDQSSYKQSTPAVSDVDLTQLVWQMSASLHGHCCAYRSAKGAPLSPCPAPTAALRRACQWGRMNEHRPGNRKTGSTNRRKTPLPLGPCPKAARAENRTPTTRAWIPPASFALVHCSIVMRMTGCTASPGHSTTACLLCTIVGRRWGAYCGPCVNPDRSRPRSVFGLLYAPRSPS